MSKISKKEFYSALKWTWIIMFASMAYHQFAPQYYFMRQGTNLYRAHKVTGSVEYLEDNEWVSVTENEISRMIRLQRKIGEAARAKEMRKRYFEANNSTEDDDDDV